MPLGHWSVGWRGVAFGRLCLASLKADFKHRVAVLILRTKLDLKVIPLRIFPEFYLSLGHCNLCLVPLGCRRENTCPCGHQQPTQRHHSVVDFSPWHPLECTRQTRADPFCLRHDSQEQQGSRGHPKTGVWGCWASKWPTPNTLRKVPSVAEPVTWRVNICLQLNRFLLYKEIRFESILLLKIWPFRCPVRAGWDFLALPCVSATWWIGIEVELLVWCWGNFLSVLEFVIVQLSRLSCPVLSGWWTVNLQQQIVGNGSSNWPEAGAGMSLFNQSYTHLNLHPALRILPTFLNSLLWR